MTWPIVFLIVGQTCWIVTAVQLGRARDPRDSDGRKVAQDPLRLRRAALRHAWALGVWGACMLVGFVIQAVLRPDLVPVTAMGLGILAVVVSVGYGMQRRRHSPVQRDDRAAG